MGRSARGLYDPRDEHDACGVGFVVDVKGRRSHEVVRMALRVLINLKHRGASGSEPNRARESAGDAPIPKSPAHSNTAAATSGTRSLMLVTRI